MSKSEKFPHIPIIVAIITGFFTLLAACVGLALPFVERLAQQGPTLTIPVEVQASTLTPLRPTYTPILPTDTPVPLTLTPQPTDISLLPTNTLAPAIFTPQPTPVSDTGEFKAVGESYEASGISLALMEYDIKSDGSIWLKFIVANQGNQKVLLRYQNKYFSVIDDTGKTYPQDEDYLLDIKQAELSPGKSFEITHYPDEYLYNYNIGYFYGKVPEQASYLIVKVSQFADLRDMQWRIPLNAQLSSPQSPAPGTQQPLLEGFSANGITVLLSDYTIRSDGAIRLKFLVQNEGNNAVLLRYQNKYFEVQDDLGNKYAQEQEHLVESKQMLLSPGKSFEITHYPDEYLYNYNLGYFYGKVPEQASYLIVKVSQFADLRDMQWRIPLK
jgi:hypothetical protein